MSDRRQRDQQFHQRSHRPPQQGAAPQYYAPPAQQQHYAPAVQHPQQPFAGPAGRQYPYGSPPQPSQQLAAVAGGQVAAAAHHPPPAHHHHSAGYAHYSHTHLPQHPPPAAAPAPPRPSHLTDVTFASLPLAPESQRALSEVLGFSHLTAVQHATLPSILAGGDIMAKAKTGTGKTMGFLIPAVEQLKRAPAAPGQISVLVLSPTRELASQIAKEADSLLTYHPFAAQVVYGGTNIKSELRRLQTGRCDILVATPGRLIDHLQNSGLQPRLAGIRTLVLDEADQLLEMGFRPAIEKVLGFLPRQRQTLLFSATMPQAVHQVAGLALRQGYEFIDTVQQEDADTNIQVDQTYSIVPMEQQLAAMLAVLRQHMATPGYKVIAFFPTARLTQFMAELANAAGIPALEIHSRKSQSAREKASAAFRSAREAVMFSSDVSARGVDYPDITLVLQVGLPSSREQYIHRLGRTARAGKRGQGLLMLAPYEQHFMRQLRDLPIVEAPAPAISAAEGAAVSAAVRRVDPRTAEQAYVAWLGFYNSAKGMGWDKPTLVQMANKFSVVLGLPEPPALLAKTIGMMGLRGTPGLRVASKEEAAQRMGNRQGGGRQGGGGGGASNGNAPVQRQQAAHQQQGGGGGQGQGQPKAGGGGGVRRNRKRGASGAAGGGGGGGNGSAAGGRGIPGRSGVGGATLGAYIPGL